jgi:hypothetical protein
MHDEIFSSKVSFLSSELSSESPRLDPDLTYSKVVEKE